jgi:hypothetical protein
MTTQEEPAFRKNLGWLITFFVGVTAIANNTLSCYSHKLTIAEKLQAQQEQQVAKSKIVNQCVEKTSAANAAEPLKVPKPFVVPESEKIAQAEITKVRPENPQMRPVLKDIPNGVAYAPGFDPTQVKPAATSSNPMKSVPKPFSITPISSDNVMTTVSAHAQRPSSIRTAQVVSSVTSFQPTSVKTFEKHTTRRNHERYVFRQQIR